MQRFEKDANIDPSNILENVRNQCHKDILHPGRYKGIVTQCFEDYEIFDPFTQEYKTIDYFEKEYFVAYSKI